MSDKRMLIVPAELVKKIDDNRGDMSQAEFIDFIIDSHFGEKKVDAAKASSDIKFATQEELRSFEQDIKKLMKNFLDFFVTYGLELGKPSISEGTGGLIKQTTGFQRVLRSFR